MRIDALPPANEIDHEVIRQAATTHAGALAALKATQKQLRDEWRDAEEAKAALAAGRTSPTASYSEHIKRLDKLERELKAAQEAVQSAHGDLQAVVDEHGDAWVESLAIRDEDLEQAWGKAVAALSGLFAQRTALSALRRKLGAEIPDIRSIRLKLGQLVDSLSGDTLATGYPPDPWNPTAGQRRRAVIQAGDVLAALASLGVEETIEIIPSSLGDQFKHVIEHSQTVQRGYHPDEEKEMARARAGREAAKAAQAASVPSGGLHVSGRPVSVYMPDSGGES